MTDPCQVPGPFVAPGALRITANLLCLNSPLRKGKRHRVYFNKKFAEIEVDNDTKARKEEAAIMERMHSVSCSQAKVHGRAPSVCPLCTKRFPVPGFILR